MQESTHSSGRREHPVLMPHDADLAGPYALVMLHLEPLPGGGGGGVLLTMSRSPQLAALHFEKIFVKSRRLIGMAKCASEQQVKTGWHITRTQLICSSHCAFLHDPPLLYYPALQYTPHSLCSAGQGNGGHQFPFRVLPAQLAASFFTHKRVEQRQRRLCASSAL